MFYLHFLAFLYHLDQCSDSVLMIDAGLYHVVIAVAVDLRIYNVLV